MEAIRNIKVRKWTPNARARHSKIGQAIWRSKLRRRAVKLIAAAEAHRSLTDEALLQRAQEAYANTDDIGTDRPADDETITLILEAIRRETTFVLHPVQVMAGIAMNQGHMIELATGEGKTLAALLASACFGLCRRPVHVMTANNYLAKRDAELGAAVGARLGLTAAWLDPEAQGEDRSRLYGCQLLYTTLHEVGFDWLRDRLSMLSGSPDRIQNRLRVALVDEADLILIDEARTPMILSGQVDEDRESLFKWADEHARKLKPDEHYRVIGDRQIELARQTYTQLIRDKPAAEAPEFELALISAVKAHLFYRINVEYAVVDGEIVIVDDRTGRLMHGRKWPHGLFEAVTIKEGLPLDKPTEHIAQVTVQQFVSQYDALAGCSGTMFGAAREVWCVYNRCTMRLPTHRPCLRKYWPTRTFVTRAEQFRAVADQIKELREEGRSVLVGTTHIHSSMRISELLKEQDVPHQVLTALDEENEAEIIAEAGHAGSVTIATNMAGRGTDIKLDADVAEAGGLHVISLQRHDSSRVDRQLVGRCARQGDPGSSQFILTLQDPLLKLNAAEQRAKLRPSNRDFGNPIDKRQVNVLWDRVQRRVESKHRESRIELINQQIKLERLIGRPDYLSSDVPLDKMDRPWL